MLLADITILTANICILTKIKTFSLRQMTSFNFLHLWKFKSKLLPIFSINLFIYLSTDHLPRFSKIYQPISLATLEWPKSHWIQLTALWSCKRCRENSVHRFLKSWQMNFTETLLPLFSYWRKHFSVDGNHFYIVTLFHFTYTWV